MKEELSTEIPQQTMHLIPLIFHVYFNQEKNSKVDNFANKGLHWEGQNEFSKIKIVFSGNRTRDHLAPTLMPC